MLKEEDEGEILFFYYRGLEIGVQELGEFSKYVVYDGEGLLLTGDSASSGQTARDNAKEWVRQFHASEDEDE